jgi:hypothetical protein
MVQKGGSTKTIVVSTPRRRSQQQPERIVIRTTRGRSPSPSPIIIRTSRRSRTPAPSPIIIRTARRSRTPAASPIIIRTARRSRTPAASPIIIRTARRSRTPKYSYPFVIASPRRRRAVEMPFFIDPRGMRYSDRYPAFGTRRPTKVVSSSVSFVPSRSGRRVVRHSRLAGIPSQPQRKPTKLSWFEKNILGKTQAKRAPQAIGQGWQQLSLK